MTEVLLGQAYYLRFDPKLWRAMQPYPPLGTLYAAACLRERGFSIALFDAMLARDTCEWEAALCSHRPRVAVLYEDSFNYLSKMCLLRMREAAFDMMAKARRHQCTVVVHGSDATDHLNRYLEHGADYILVGEGEQTLAELLQALRSGQAPEGIAGLVSRENVGRPVIPRSPRRDLDALPFPAWDLVDAAKYRSVWLKHHGYFSINMVTTRGCPYHCNWCAKPIYGQRYHSRSPENVVAELRWLKDRVGPDHISFSDDILGLKPGWIARFAELVTRENLQTPFKCLLRTDLVTDAVASSLKKAGCRTVWLGAESGSQKVLDAMEKGATVEDTYRATRRLRRVGIEVAYFLQFGYPEEEWEDIRKTLKLVRDAMPDDIGVSVSYPLPGTGFHERVGAELEGQANWKDSEDLAMLFRGRFVPGFYRCLHRVLHREYRARKAVRGLRRGDWSGWPALLRLAALPLDLIRLHGLRLASPMPGREHR